MKLVENWKQGLRFWSIQLGALGTLLTSYLIAFPDAALYAWSLLPTDIKAHIPPRYMPLVGVAIFVISMLTRLVRQRKLEHEQRMKALEERAKELTP
jgi:hypothetical protein